MCCDRLRDSLFERGMSSSGPGTRFFELKWELEVHCEGAVNERVDYHALALVASGKDVEEYRKKRIAEISREKWEEAKREAEAILGLAQS